MNAGSVIRRVELIINDEGQQYPTFDIYPWIEDGEIAVINNKPDAASKTISLTLQAGAKQELPADVSLLMDISRNEDGTPIVGTDMKALDCAFASWANEEQSGTIENYATNDKDRRTFYVFPPAIAGTVVEAIVAQKPAEITSAATELSVGDEYRPALVDYVCYRLFSIDSETGMQDLALKHQRAFMQAIGVKRMVEAKDGA